MVSVRKTGPGPLSDLAHATTSPRKSKTLLWAKKSRPGNILLTSAGGNTIHKNKNQESIFRAGFVLFGL